MRVSLPARRVLRSVAVAAASAMLLSLMAPPAAAGHQYLWWNEDGASYKRFTAAGSSITIYQGAIEYSCDGFYPAADIYIVPSGSVADGAALSDVGGAPNTVFGASGGIFIEETIGRTGSTGLGTGRYAVVYDECQDKKFNADEDFLLDPAFSIEITTDVPPITDALAAAKARAATQAQIHLLAKRSFEWYEQLQELKEAVDCVMGGLATCAVSTAIDALREKLIEEGKKALGLGMDAKEATLKHLGDLVSYYLGIAADPPDPAYTQLSPPLPAPRIDAASSDPDDIASATLAEAAAVDAALAESFLRSAERYQGADEVSDGEWALVHAIAAQSTALRLADRAAPTAAAFETFRAALVAEADDLDAIAADVEPHRARVEQDGFTAEEVRELNRRGLDETEIAELRSILSVWDFTATTESDLLAAIDESIRETRDAETDYRTSAAEFQKLIDHLRVQPSQPDTHPVARPGGPYTVAEGSALALDGSTSSDPDGTVATFEWDTDGDGAYDDATGATPSVAAGPARTGMIGLRVTDNHGRQGLAHALVTVTDVQSPPRIDSLTPDVGEHVVVLGDALSASVTATDPDGDPLTYRWSLDGVPSGTASTFSWTPTSTDVGAHSLIVEVSDGTVVGGTTVASLAVSVVYPDADGDTWDSSLDCDDTNPDVHPGRREVVGNSLDDDCNAATPDEGLPPTAAFTHAPELGHVGQPVAFTDTSSDTEGPIVTWSWEFGDGATSAEQHPTHTYASAGSYEVTLTVTDEQGNPDSVVRTIETTNVPVADFTLATEKPDAGVATQLTDTSTDDDGTIVAWAWSFGDGATSTEQHPVHTWAAHGVYDVSLTVTDDRGVTGTASRAVTVLAAPAAFFNPLSSGRNVSQLEAGATVHSRSSQYDSTHAPWRILDGIEDFWPWATGNGQNTNQWMKIDLVDDVPYLIDRVFVRPRTAYDDQRVRDFAVAVSTTTADDAAFTTVLEATAANNGLLQEFVFDTPVFAKYVRYSPLNNQGSWCCISTHTFKVRTGQHGGATVTFDNLSTDADGDGELSYSWDFGDGSAGSTEKSPTHTFPGPGTYSVALTVVDADGRSSTRTLTQRVLAPPAVSFTASESPAEGQPATFTDTTTHPEGSTTTGRTWAWGDATAPTLGQVAPQHTYVDDGTYAVTLTIDDSFGQSASVTRDVMVANLPPAVNLGSDWIFYEDTPLAFGTTVTDPGRDTWTCRWDHGDGSALRDGCGFSHTYAEPGVYTAALTATDEDGAATTKTMTITVKARPIDTTPPAGGTTGAPVAGTDVTYTTGADFDQATQLNVNDETPDQLQLNRTARPFPYVNVAASGRGTLLRIDVESGAIVGEYFTAPHGRARNPSRTTVDQLGNVWVTNRDESTHSGGRPKGSISRVGLLLGGTRVGADGRDNAAGEYLAPPFTYSTCRDRDGDGLIRTSRGRGHILPWTNTGGVDNHGGVATAVDECVINYTRVEATGARTVAIDANNDVWVGGSGNQAHEKLSGDTGQPVPGTAFDMNCGGYGGFVDRNGVLWSARSGAGLLRYDTNTRTGRCIGNGHGDYGLGSDPRTGDIWHSNLAGNRVVRLNSSGTETGRFPHGNYHAQGVAVDGSQNVWVAHALFGAQTVGHVRTDGTHVGNVPLPGGAGPTGVAVDANGRVWVANYVTNNVQRIDPEIGRVGAKGLPIGHVDLTVDIGHGARPYNYSDMTGIVAIGSTSPQGFWSVIQDGGAADTRWGTVTWNTEAAGSVPAGTSITVEARAAGSESALADAAWTPVTSGQPFDLTGRYLEVRATLKTTHQDVSPVLSDVRILAGPTNELPVAADQAVITPEDTPVAVTLAATDQDGDDLTYEVVDQPQHGALSGTAPDLTYTPHAEFSGADSLTFLARDGEGPSNTATVAVTVTPVDDPPTVQLDPAGPMDEGPAAIALTAHAQDVDTEMLTWTWSSDSGHVIGDGANATLQVDDGPDVVRVTVTVSDGTSHASSSQDVEVRNVAPRTDAGEPLTRHWGLPVTLSGSVTDPSHADTLAGLSPTWEPGDGSAALSGTAVEHVYADPGSYTATLHAADKDGGVSFDTTTVEVTRRPTAMDYTGDTSAVFGFARLSAALADDVDPATGDVSGRDVVFNVGGQQLTATTGADGVATVTEPVLLPPGMHAVEVTYAGDSHYVGSADSAVLVISNSIGKVTGGHLKVDDIPSSSRASGGFTEQSDGTVLKGELQYQADGMRYHASELTGLGISPDRRSAWFTGHDREGRTFTAYIEDNGTPGSGNDVFQLWIDGQKRTREGTLSGGNLVIHR